jgi:hypothetical protein
MLPTKFRFIWQSSLREEDFLEINQSETRIVFGALICELHHRTKMSRNKIKQDFNFTTLKVGSILGRSSIKIAHLVPIRQQTWPP